MDYSSFGLSAPPFSLAPSRSSIFMSGVHREALATLEWGIRDPEGFVMVVGEPGTGKTSLVAQLLQTNRDGVKPVYMNQPTTFLQILKLVASELSAEPSTGTAAELGPRIKRILAERKLRLVLIFDEAQALSDDTFEALRLFANESITGTGGIKLVLLGHPKLRERMASPALQALDQRIITRSQLLPLAGTEIEEYIDYRLRMCGGTAQQVFTAAALRVIKRNGSRIPREINLLCQNALIHTYARGVEQVDAAAVAAALADRRGPSRRWPRQGALGGQAWLRPVVVATTAAAMSSALALWQLPGVSLLRTSAQAWEDLRQREQSLAVTTDGTVAAAAPVQGATVRQAPPPETTSTTLRASPFTDSALAAWSRDEQAANAEALLASLQPPPTDLLRTPGADYRGRTVTASSHQPSNRAHNVIIQKGDTLTSVALANLGSAGPAAIKRIIQANPSLTVADLIYAGQTLQIPKDRE